MNPEIDREVVLANKKSITGFLTLFHEKYPTANQYLTEIGLTDKEIIQIYKKSGVWYKHNVKQG